MMKSFSLLCILFILTSCIDKIVDRHEKKDKLTTTKKSALDGTEENKTGDGSGNGNGAPGSDNGSGGPGIDDGNGDPTQVPPSTDNNGNNNDNNQRDPKLNIVNDNPFVTDGIDNDVQVNRVTCEVFQKNQGEWVLIEKLKNCDEFVIKKINDPSDAPNPLERNTLYWVQAKTQGYRRDPNDPTKLKMVLDGNPLSGNQVIREPRAPLATDGNDGDVFIDTTKPLHYVKNAGNWIPVCDLEQSINPCGGGTPSSDEGQPGEWKQDPNRSIWKKNEVGTWILMSEIKVVEKANKSEISNLVNKDNLTIYIDTQMNDGYIFKGTNLVQVFKNRKNDMNVVHVGPGNPNDRVTQFGNPGDVYLTKDNGDMYRKQRDGTWEMSCEGGAFGYWCGTIPPQDKNGGKFGKNQDLYKQTTNGDIYQKINKKWVKIYPRKFEYTLIQIPFEEVEDPIPGNLYINTITLKGYTVENGEEFDLSDGKNKVHTGDFDPTQAGNKVRRSRDGDFYYNTSNNFYYKKDNGKWRGICVLNYRGYHCGEQNPANSLGADGEIYLQQDRNKNVWLKVEGEWKKLGLDSPTRVEYIENPDTLAKLKDANTKIENYIIEINNLNNEIDDLKLKLKIALANTPDDQSATINKLNDEIEKLKKAKQDLEKEVVDLSKRPKQEALDQLAQENEEHEAEIKRLQDELAKATEGSDDPVIVDNSEVENLKAQIDKLKEEKAEKDRRIAELKRQLADNTVVDPDPSCDCDDLLNQINDKDELISSLRSQLEQANANNNDGQIAELQKQLEDAEEKKKLAEDALADKKQEITQLKEEHAAALLEKDEKITVLVEENKALKEANEKLQATIVEYQTILEVCKQDPPADADANTELTPQQQYDCEELEKKLEELDNLKKQLANQKTELDKCVIDDANIDQVRHTKDCAELRKKYLELLGELKEALANQADPEQIKNLEEAKAEAEAEKNKAIAEKNKAEEDKNDALAKEKAAKEEAKRLEQELKKKPTMTKVCELFSVDESTARSNLDFPLPYEVNWNKKSTYKGYDEYHVLFNGQGNTATKVSNTGSGKAYVSNSHVLIAFDMIKGMENCGWDPNSVTIKSVKLEFDYNLQAGNPVNHKSRPSEFICMHHRDLRTNPCSGKFMEDANFPGFMHRDYEKVNSKFHNEISGRYSGTKLIEDDAEIDVVDYFEEAFEDVVKKPNEELLWFIFTDDIKLDWSKLSIEREVSAN